MVRAVLATVAALMLVGVLSLLIVESRAVKENYYVGHAERLRAIESSRNDIDAIIQGTRDAFDEGRAIPLSIDLAYANLSENLDLLRVPTDPVAADSLAPAHLVAYDEQLQQFIASGQAYAARQNAQADALRLLQEVSPTVVKELRRFNLRIESQNAFSLALDVIEFAMGRNPTSPQQLAERIDALRNDQNVAREAPGRLDAFAAAANRIVEEHTAAEAALADIGNSAIADELSALSAAILDDNRRIVSRAERARVLLAVCAVLLLLGAGYAMLRLQNSYRDLNKSNADLAKLNDSLEQRVTARTEELSEAYEELKESQVQLVQAEKMSSLGELVAGISHEINTPLWYLMSNSAVIQERLADIGEFLEIANKMVTAAKRKSGVKEAVSSGLVDMNRMLTAGMKDDMDEAKDLVQDSIDGLEELTELAQSLKDFSRLDRAKQGEFNVNDGLNKTLLIIKNKIKDKVTVHKHYGEVPNILCSPSQINQVFLNLISNASDAIEKQGEVVLHTWEKDGKVGIRVADTGCGISEEQLGKIRDPFFTTKEVGKGTGLGLSIVDQIITAHHGELTIESVPGKGTTITVELPLKPPTEAAPANTASDEETPADTADVGEDTPAVASEVAGKTPADASEPADDDGERTWGRDTNVSSLNIPADESPEASNDGPDTAKVEIEATGGTDWASDTHVSNVSVVANDAVNDDEALEPSAAADEPAESEAGDPDNEDDTLGSHVATIVSDWNIGSDVVDIFGQTGASANKDAPAKDSLPGRSDKDVTRTPDTRDPV